MSIVSLYSISNIPCMFSKSPQTCSSEKDDVLDDISSRSWLFVLLLTFDLFFLCMCLDRVYTLPSEYMIRLLQAL
jgi:hypothetical protein